LNFDKSIKNEQEKVAKIIKQLEKEELEYPNLILSIL